MIIKAISMESTFKGKTLLQVVEFFFFFFFFFKCNPLQEGCNDEFGRVVFPDTESIHVLWLGSYVSIGIINSLIK